MNNFFVELRRRNIFRVAGVYAVVCWLLIQVIVAIKTPLGLPDWTDTFFIVLVLAGLPIVLLFAWAFELTPDGVKRTESVPEGESITHKTSRIFDYMILGGLALVGLLIIGDRVMPDKAGAAAIRTATANAGHASVAVLPFIDLSPNGDQEFFSDGISEEILNVLVRIPDLKVAGRTSSFSFKGKNEDLRAIGTSLGVDHVLEGSVRKSGTKLRITAQLIRSDDGFHMWSETYDRELTDVFDIQDDIARAVADELAISLGLVSGESLVKSRTDDLVAYEKYLKARQLYLARGADNLDKALLLLNEVTARDPGFAPAWSLIGGTYCVYEAYQPTTPPTGDWRQWRAIGEAAAQRAIALDPDNAEAHAFLGTLLIYEGKLIEGAAAKDRAVSLAGDNPSVLDSVAQSLYALGYWSEAIALAKRAVEIDPLVPIFRNTLGYTTIGLARFDEDDALLQEGLDHLAKVREIGPSIIYAYGNALRAYLRAGRFEEAEALVASAVAHDVFPATTVEDMQSLLAAEEQGDAALREFFRSGPTGLRVAAVAILDDPDIYVEFVKPIWDGAYQVEPFLFYHPDREFFADPRWKAEVHRQGVFALWQSRGFPEWCHPVGSDDFACDGGSD